MNYKETCIELQWLAENEEIELNEWEHEFIMNILNNYTDDKFLSDKQIEKIEQIWEKHG